MDEPIISGLKKTGTFTLTGHFDDLLPEEVWSKVGHVVKLLGRQFTLLETQFRKTADGIYELTGRMSTEELQELKEAMRAHEKYLKRVRGGQRRGATLTSKQRRHARKVANARAQRQAIKSEGVPTDGIEITRFIDVAELTAHPGGGEHPGERHEAPGASAVEGPKQSGDRLQAGPGEAEPGASTGGDRGDVG